MSRLEFDPILSYGSNDVPFGFYRVYTGDLPNPSRQYMRVQPSSSLAGYGSQLPSYLYSYNDDDRVYNYFLPESANLIINGDFETSDLSAWTYEGTFETDLTEYSGHSGLYAANFQQNNVDLDWFRLTQSVALSSNLHKPTLGFTYRYSEVEEGWLTSPFFVEIETSLGDTLTYTNTAQDTDWHRSWVDLSNWEGQQITLTIGISQTWESFLQSFMVDEVFIDEWYTPVITELIPSQVVPGESFTMTILGENFIMTPTVRLDDTVITDVLILDEHTLQITLSEGLPVGFYDIWVINPGGQMAVRPFISGTPLYLQLISKGP